MIDEMVRKPGPWLSTQKDTGIIISSRVRLARNIAGFRFPGWADEQEAICLCEDLRNALVALPAIADSDPICFDMNSLPPVDKDILKERHLISNELALKGAGSALIVARDEHVGAMINEEDHLRLQAISPGLNLKAVWEKINNVDTQLENRFEYAFSSRLGYLTACPTNVGTGLRASVMMHLSGLRLLNEIDAVIRGLDKMGFAVRGLLGEGSEANGNMFQISNQGTLGETEMQILDNLVEIVEEVAGHEQNARERLMCDQRTYLHDQVARALGVLMFARMLSSTEAIDLLSGLRLGVELAIIRGLSVMDINEIMLLTQPGHLQKMSAKILSIRERDEIRSKIVAEKLKNVHMCD
ncbi:MAG: protein arginine kinase [Lentisphaerae bacterium]|nr:protein arginine kinase [Lentisphaerota bacterium]